MDKMKTFEREPNIVFPKEMVEGSIVARFEQQANLYPDKVAVKCQTHSLTYRELDTAANLVAQAILASQLDQSETIGMLFDHNVFAVVAILGILKTGKAYIPLDPTFPPARLKYMMEDSQTSLVLANNKSFSVAVDLVNNPDKIINIDEFNPDVPSGDPDRSIFPDDLAYILYSSGSTGQPKGIVQNHRNVLHHVWDHTTIYHLGVIEKQGLVLSFGFAASVSEIFGAILNGATLCLYDIKQGGLNGLASWLASEEITVIKIPISLFRIFLSVLSGGEQFPKLRLVILGGDTLYRKDLINFRKYFSPDCVLVNRLTSTETNSVTQLIIKPGMEIKDRVIPVGYPALDKEIKIIDEAGQDVGPDVVGEIVIRSRYITPGYWHRDELTQGSFRGYSSDDPVQVFYTGDLGRLRPDGCLEHIGRKDFMVKIRGYRVEIAEITAALLDMDSIEDAIVIAIPDSIGEKQLVAYVVPQDPSTTSVNVLRSGLAEDLPDYMIPTDFVILEKLPKTPTGKIDYQRLTEIQSTVSNLATPYSAPQTPLEEQLVEIWERVLDHSKIGVEDDYFELGGNSLDALRLVAEVEDKLGKPLSLPLFFQARTIAKLVESLQGDQGPEYTYLVALSTQGSKTPFFCLPPSATTVMTFGRLAQYMGGDRPFYGLEYAGMDGKSEPDLDITRMAEYYLKEIQSVQPEGPYYLGGMCFGGLVAFELAQQLLTQGQAVAFLGILDSTHAPNLSNPRGYYVFLVTRFINQKFLRKNFTIGATSIRIPEDDVFRNRVQHVFSSHNYARMKYRTTPYPGTITLFSTSGGKGQFSRIQWEPVAMGKLEVITIPGTHTGHGFGLQDNRDTFIREPHVQVLAEKLRDSLNKAEKGVELR